MSETPATSVVARTGGRVVARVGAGGRKREWSACALIDVTLVVVASASEIRCVCQVSPRSGEIVEAPSSVATAVAPSVRKS